MRPPDFPTAATRFSAFYSHQPCRKVPVSPHAGQHLAFFFCIVTQAIMMGVKWYLIVALTSIFSMTRDVKCFFHVLLGPLRTFFGETPIQVIWSCF